jgi:hypothetical protein
MKALIFAAIATCLLWMPAYAQDSCLTQKEIATDGVHLGDSEALVRSRLGHPRKITQGHGEDDGGRYQTRSLAYPSMVVTLGRNRVESIEIRGPHHLIAGGLSVSDPSSALQLKALIDNSDLAHGAAFGLRLCDADLMESSGLSIFVAHGRVTRAVLYTYGP